MRSFYEPPRGRPARFRFEANDSGGEPISIEWLFPADSNSSNRLDASVKRHLPSADRVPCWMRLHQLDFRESVLGE
jgi:hypothetical protein